MAKSKREEKDSEKEGDYEFKLPAFDEATFIRKEVYGARASFYTLGLGFLAGVVAALVQVFGGQAVWQVGWLVILGTMAFLRPLLVRMGFPAEVTQPKALVGSYFMLFFTALAVWILGVNLLR